MSSPIAPAFDMGELWLPYTQYRDVVDSRGLHESHFIAVDPSIAQEDFQKRLRQLTLQDAATVDLAGIASDVQKTRVRTRHMDLLEKGFAGTITGLFDRVMVASYAVNHVGLPLDTVVDPESQEQIATEIAIYEAIPPARRKGAKVVEDGRAYYWGGRYVLMPIIQVEEVKEPATAAKARDIHAIIEAAKANVVIDGGAESVADDEQAEVRPTGLRLVHSEPKD